MAGYNRMVMVGNLTRDPEHKQLPSGQAVCRLGLAANRQFKNRQSGEMVQEVCYVDVDVWGPQADSCNQYLEKGRQVLVEGRLKFDSWQDQDGKNRSKHSIVADRVVFLSNQSDSASSSERKSDTPEKMEPRNEVERELMQQLEDIKQRASSTDSKPAVAPAKKVTAPKKAESVPQSANASAAFKDEAPFSDDLPF